MKKNLPYKPKQWGVLFILSVLVTFNVVGAQKTAYITNVNYQPTIGKVQSTASISLKEALQKLQKQLNLSLIYNPSDVDEVVVPNADFESALVAKNVEKVLKETNLTAHKISESVFVIKSKNAPANINVPKTGFKISETQDAGTTPSVQSTREQDLPRDRKSVV